MPPIEQYQSQTPNQNNLGFIMSPEQPKRSFGTNFFDGSKKSFFILIGVAVGFFILLFIIYEIFKPAGIQPVLAKVVASQQEITRIANEASGQANSQSTKNFAVTTSLSLASQENQLLSLMKANGMGVTKNQIALAHDSGADSTLQQAIQASNFDPVFVGILQGKLKGYQSLLKQTYNQTNSPIIRTQFANDYQGATLLLKQSSSSYD